MEEHVTKVPFDKEFRICPSCGYPDGFHTMLKKEGKSIKWLFICPNCHKIFDIGCTVSLTFET